MKLRFGLLVPMMLLAGCGLPPAVIVVSYAADGLSYMASGKSVTDHALSALAQQDCALHRVITEANLCRNNGVADVAGEVRVAAVPPAGEIAPRRLQPRWGPVTASLPVADVRQPRSEPVADEGAYLVVASFAYWVNTDRFMTQYEALAPEVVPSEVDGEVVYRVVTFAGPDAVGAAGLSQAWPLRLCRDVENVLAACERDQADGINIAALTR